MAVRKLTLDNGLRVVAVHNPLSAMAVVDVLYDVGSRDESRRLTGIAHLFEHLMFGGSANVPSFDGELESAGGKSNAWTGPDFTNFYDILPARNIATAFHLESDRMLALDFKPETLAVQKGVVIEEFKQTCLNSPYGDLSHRLREVAYAAGHPYSWPTIGLTPDHIAAVTEDDVRAWFYAHYAPNNAILTVTSPLPAEKVFDLARLWFGDIPRRHIAPRRLPGAGFPAEGATATVHGRAPQPRIVVAYPMDPYGTPDYFAADTLTDILAYGASGRMQRRLVDGPLAGFFAGADASIVGSEHPGLLLLNAMITDNSDEACHRAAAMLREQFEALARPGDITDAELERTLNNFEATFRMENVSAMARTFTEATAEYHGEDPAEMIARRRTLTPADLTGAAARIAAREPVVIIYKS